jgi:glycerol kinase
MPEVKYSDEIFGYTTAEGLFEKPVPVTGVMGDSHGALFAQQCFDAGMTKCTFGTGMSVMMNTGAVAMASSHRIGTTIAWGVSGSVEYALEGTANFTGDVMQWMIHDLGILDDAGKSAEMARTVPSAEGVYLVPAFAGIGAPWWSSSARAMICGMRRTTNRRHLIRAGLESTVYQLKDIIEAMKKDAGTELAELRTDGGPADNDFMMQFAADLLRADIVSNEVEELSALGAVYAGGLATGIWKDRAELAGLFRPARMYHPKMTDVESGALYGGWLDAVRMLTGK